MATDLAMVEAACPTKKKRMSRAEKAGRAVALALVEMVHLMYQDNTARNFWRGLMAVLKENER
jgi:hypothetical protein